MPSYRIFGLTLTSDFAFSNPLLPAAAGATPDVTFTCRDQAPMADTWRSVTPVYASPISTDGGDSIMTAYRQDGCDILHFPRVADFYLWPDRIACHLLDPSGAPMVEIHLLGPALSVFLELRGIPALHASAVVFDRWAVAFLAGSRGGKSALAAALVSAGHPLLADDILPIELVSGRWVGRASYPSMRMWPDEAQHFLPKRADLARVHPLLDKRRVRVGPGGFGTFCSEPAPLACIYVPERCDPITGGETVQIEPLRAADALMALVCGSFAARAAEAFGLQRRRIPLLAGLLQQVPVRRLIYPGGFERLPRVREAILEDLRQLPPHIPAAA